MCEVCWQKGWDPDSGRPAPCLTYQCTPEPEEPIPDTERSVPSSKPVQVWVNRPSVHSGTLYPFWAVSYVNAQGELVTWLYASEATARMMADRVRSGEFR